MTKAELITIPARKGRACRLTKGQAIKIINTHGHQVVDTWAFSAEDLHEFMSMEHMRADDRHDLPDARATISAPTAGAPSCTSRKTPRPASMTRCSRPATTIATACSAARNITTTAPTISMRGCARSVSSRRRCLSPLNLWMNIPVDKDGKTGWGEPVSKPGDYVVLRARMDCVVAMSACPQDILPINKGKTVEAHYQILS